MQRIKISLYVNIYTVDTLVFSLGRVNSNKEGTVRKSALPQISTNKPPKNVNNYSDIPARDRNIAKPFFTV